MNKLIQFFKSLKKPPQDWRLVKTITVAAEYTSTTGGRELKQKCKVYFYLYESDRGKRRYEAKSTVDSKIKGSEDRRMLESLEDFCEVVHPWLNGAFDPEIPSYSDMDMVDVQSKLSA